MRGGNQDSFFNFQQLKRLLYKDFICLFVQRFNSFNQTR
nr:MAG TPA: hypothetical protein [Ackermannviridae sp.]